MTTQEKQRNARLLRTYGITLEDYNLMLRDQGYGCWVCGWQPQLGQKALAVDHDHKVSKVRVLTKKTDSGWKASATYKEHEYTAESTLKRNAVADVKQQLKKASCRGLLCWRHNRAIEMFQDSPERLRRAAEYLERLEPRYD